MSDFTEEPAFPPYTQPAVSVRATWAATDGGRPEEVIIEWRDKPEPREVIAISLAVIRSGGQIHPAPEASEGGLWKGSSPVATECGAQGEGHTSTKDAIHWCALSKGHEPIEPDGRAHRCLCGGLFAATDEVLDVPGRRGRDDRRSR